MVKIESPYSRPWNCIHAAGPKRPRENAPAIDRANYSLQRLPIISVPKEVLDKVEGECGPEYLRATKLVILYAYLNCLRAIDRQIHHPIRFKSLSHRTTNTEILSLIPGYDHPYSPIKPWGVRRPIKSYQNSTPEISLAATQELENWRALADKKNKLRQILDDYGYDSYYLSYIRGMRKAKVATVEV